MPLRHQFDPLAAAQQPQSSDSSPPLPRIFVDSHACRVHVKLDSARLFCHQAAEGEDHYHRISQGELFVLVGEEKLCLPCAAKRGLLRFQPQTLRDAIPGRDLNAQTPPEPYDLDA